MSTRVLLTGASGFLGSNLLNVMTGWNLVVMGRTPVNDLPYIYGDLMNPVDLRGQHFDWVIHCAGMAHSIPRSKEENNAFYEVNYSGTNRLLSALEKSPPEGIVFISSVAVYGLDEGHDINENQPLAGTDPYAHSKILAERALLKWGERMGVNIAILRLPLVVGNNPTGNLKQMIEAIKKRLWFNIDGGTARRSSVWANDIVDIIPTIARCGGIYNLTDGIHPSYFQLNCVIARSFNLKPGPQIPSSVIRPVARIFDLKGFDLPVNSRVVKKLTSTLTFADNRARNQLGWHPHSVLDILPKCLKQ